jgi:hypothetical protein
LEKKLIRFRAYIVITSDYLGDELPDLDGLKPEKACYVCRQALAKAFYNEIYGRDVMLELCIELVDNVFKNNKKGCSGKWERGDKFYSAILTP